MRKSGTHRSLGPLVLGFRRLTTKQPRTVSPFRTLAGAVLDDSHHRVPYGPSMGIDVGKA